MKLMLAGAVFCVLLAAASARCPNFCSGHGSCQSNPKDTCQCHSKLTTDENWEAGDTKPYGKITLFSASGPAWTGADCSHRTCPTGEIWAGVPRSDNDHTTRKECSGVGLCDRKTGMCACFAPYTGTGCRRTLCPKDCSGHGTCQSLAVIARSQSHDAASHVSNQYGTPTVTTSPEAHLGARYAGAADSNRNYGCRCHGGFFGPGCEKRRCTSSSDPLGGKGASEGKPCSGRGKCDEVTGQCDCFSGYSGQTCETQSSTVVQ